MSALNGLDGCCDDGTTTVPQPPFSDLRKARRWNALQLFDVKNPIPEQVEDDKKITKFFEDWKLVPYAGGEKHTGHRLLYFRLMLAQLSPMQAACIQKLKNYVVGSRAFFKRSEDPEFDTGIETAPLTSGEIKTYNEALQSFVDYKGGIRGFHKKAFWQLKTTGNAWIEVSWTTVNGEARFYLKTRKSTEVMYKVTEPGEWKVVAVSPVWTDEYLKRYPPTLIPIGPNFVTDSQGVNRMMFHLKEGDGRWYGTPDSEGSTLYQYGEVQNSVYLVKQTAGNFVGQMIIEVEDDDPETNPAIDEEGAQRAGFSSFASRVEENFTAQGHDPQAVIITARPTGSRPMFVFQVKPNTNEGWYKTMGERAEQIILRSHGLTMRFLGFDTANGFSSDAYVADYVMNVEPTINSLRADLMGFSNFILTNIWQIVGREDLNEISIFFKSPIESQIEQYKSGLENGNPNSDNSGRSPGQQPGG